MRLVWLLNVNSTESAQQLLGLVWKASLISSLYDMACCSNPSFQTWKCSFFIAKTCVAECFFILTFYFDRSVDLCHDLGRAVLAKLWSVQGITCTLILTKLVTKRAKAKLCFNLFSCKQRPIVWEKRDTFMSKTKETLIYSRKTINFDWL